MNRYQARINPVSFYAYIVRVDRPHFGDQNTAGEENLIHGYKGRHFASLKAAEKSTAAYIAKHHAA